MNYHKITKHDVANGTGIRVVLWVSGCSLKCYNCHNPQTWDFNSGTLFTEDAMQELFKALDKPYIAGLTLSGGHPLDPLNASTILELVKQVKAKFPDKDIWVYTGYTWKYVMRNQLLIEIMRYIDILVDGEYMDELKNVSLAFRGSSNQRLIDVQKSLKQNKVVFWKSKIKFQKNRLCLYRQSLNTRE